MEEEINEEEIQKEYRHFAILNTENLVINVCVFPRNPEPITEQKWKDFYAWVYDGSVWNLLDEHESSILEYEDETVGYVDSLTGDVQEYLNNNFPDAPVNYVVFNRENLPEEVYVLPEIESMLIGYDESCRLVEYSLDQTITNTRASINSTYDESLNAFIPPCDDETYILNLETFQWEPDLNIDYDLYGDGTMYRWDGESWVLSD